MTPRGVGALGVSETRVPVRVGYAPIPRAAAESPAGWYPARWRCPWWADLRNVSSEWLRSHVETLIGLRPSSVTYHGATFALGEDPEALRRAYNEALDMTRGYTLLHGARSYPARWWANVTAALFDAYRTDGSTQRIR